VSSKAAITTDVFLLLALYSYILAGGILCYRKKHSHFAMRQRALQLSVF